MLAVFGLTLLVLCFMAWKQIRVSDKLLKRVRSLYATWQLRSCGGTACACLTSVLQELTLVMSATSSASSAMVRGGVGQEPQARQAGAAGTAVDSTCTDLIEAARTLAEAVEDLQRRTREGGDVDAEVTLEIAEAMAAIKGLSEAQSTTPHPYPEGWPHSGGDCQLVPLPRDSDEFRAVEAMLCSDTYAEGSDMRLAHPTTRVPGKDMSGTVVDSVISVQNQWLLDRFCHHKVFMQQREGGGDPNELWLWHGSSATRPEELCCGYDGIDIRRSRGGYYGYGAYFAEQPRYSDAGYAYKEEGDDNPAGSKQMILARVLCGRTKDMGPDIDSSITVPPEGYDSIRGGLHCPRGGGREHSSHMRAVYDNASVYPAYIVTYRTHDACVAACPRSTPTAKAHEVVSKGAGKLRSAEMNVKQAPAPHHQAATPQKVPGSHDESVQCDTSMPTCDETSTRVKPQRCPEGDLRQWIQAKPRSVREVASMAYRLLLLLLSLHSEGVIHGDIKPGNILISDELQPRISGRRGSGGESASRVKGSEGYVAPEVLAGSPTTRASDMFAMGKVLQRMLEAMADVDVGDDASMALKQEMQALAEACCAEKAADRPTAEVQLSPSHSHPSAQLAARRRIAVRRVASVELHFCWEVQQDDGSWQRLDGDHAGSVVVKYPQHLAPDVQQHEADEGEGEGKGDDGGPTGHGGPPLAALAKGSSIIVRASTTCQWGDVDRLLADLFPYPKAWHQGGGDCELVPLPRDDAEFKAVEAVLCSDVHAVGSDMRLADPATRQQLGRDMRGAVVLSVTRVQNKPLWWLYSRQKMFMEQREGGGDPNELWLWHGSSTTNPEVLCRSHDGIDVLRSRGGYLGYGAYFSEQPRYSDFCFAYEGEGLRNPSGYKQLILARVLCGEAKEMGAAVDRSITHPPQGYDSLRGGLHYPADPKKHSGAEQCFSHIRAVYDRARVYPAYIVGYKQSS